MKRDLPSAVSPDLERVFRDLIQEESQQVIKERRASHREPLVRPVTIVLKGEHGNGPPIEGFSKNCSPAGLGLVTSVKFDDRQIAVIEIHRLSKPSVRVLAECRWTDTFGMGWFYSGWTFLSLARN